jgi:hypothetical protein
MTGRAPLWTRRRPLTQKQWDGIQKASGLPDKARVWVEHALAIYAALCAASEQPAANEVREELSNLGKRADNLIKAIEEISPRAFAALALVPDDIGAGAVAASRRDTFQFLQRQLEAVAQLRSWFDAAVRALPRDSSGARRQAEANRYLAGLLDAILCRHTGRHISRSYKRTDVDWVRLCFAAVDVDVGTGSVEKAMRALRGQIAGKKNS